MSLKRSGNPGLISFPLSPSLLILSQETFFVSASLFHATSQSQPQPGQAAEQNTYWVSHLPHAVRRSHWVDLWAAGRGRPGLPMNNGLATAVCT